MTHKRKVLTASGDEFDFFIRLEMTHKRKVLTAVEETAAGISGRWR
jgi:hypothetical protein